MEFLPSVKSDSSVGVVAVSYEEVLSICSQAAFKRLLMALIHNIELCKEALIQITKEFPQVANYFHILRKELKCKGAESRGWQAASRSPRVLVTQPQREQLH